jgi:hypothetical protein
MTNAEFLEKLKWAIRLAQEDGQTFRERDWIKNKEDLIDFVRDSGTPLAITGSGWSNPKTVRKWVAAIQTGLREHFAKLAQASAVKAVERRLQPTLEDVGIKFPVHGSFTVGAFTGGPYRLLVKTDRHETQVYSALASYLVSSGIVAGQIRRCVTCSRLFLQERKPRSDVKNFHCSQKCAGATASKNYRKRHADKLKANERDRSHKRYAKKIQQKFHNAPVRRQLRK